MNVASIETSDGIAEVLGSVRKKGVKLWLVNGQLHYRAPKGVLTQEEIVRLRASRVQIAALLERANGVDASEVRSRPRLDRAPLAFSQLAHWHLYRLGERSGMRQIASATRLRGHLNVDALQASVSEIIRRHDALRTRIVVVDGVPIQEISESGDCTLRVHDLTATPEDRREAEVTSIIEQHILEPVDFATGPVFAARLLRLRDDEHVLIMAMEHMISDGFSKGILLRDVFTAYMQAAKGRAFSLPAIPIQFPEYAVWRRNAQRSWLEEHGAYWRERLRGCQRLRFPEDQDLQTEARSGWGTVPLQIGRSLKADLREWCRLRRTTLAIGAFTAYVALVLRWCNASEVLIKYESDGRVSPDIENTIGFFASVLYLGVELLEDDRLVDLMGRVTNEYCKAYEHADFSCMAAQVPRPDFTRNTVFNWVPQASKDDLSDESEHAITCSPVRFTHPMLKEFELDHEPGILLYDTDDEIVGALYFPLNRFSADTMERFCRNYMLFIKALLSQPEACVKDIVLCK